MKGILPKGPTRTEIFERRWGALSAYNAEVARGLVHTPEYDAFMADVQREYDRESAAGTLWENGAVFDFMLPGSFLALSDEAEATVSLDADPDTLIEGPSFIQDETGFLENEVEDQGWSPGDAV